MNTQSSPAVSRTCAIYRCVLSFARVYLAKRPLARLLSTFLCSVIIVIRPFSRLGGQYAFLVLALKELIFGVQENLAQQLELTMLNILGALTGIGVSTLAKYIASLAGQDTAGARATCFIFLISISFFGEQLLQLSLPSVSRSTAGIIKSRLVRLQLSTRISCFISIWLLTNDIGLPAVCVFCQASNIARLSTISFLFSTACTHRLWQLPVDYPVRCRSLSSLSARHDARLPRIGDELRVRNGGDVCVARTMSLDKPSSCGRSRDQDAIFALSSTSQPASTAIRQVE